MLPFFSVAPSTHSLFDEAFQPEPIKLFDWQSTEQTDAWLGTCAVCLNSTPTVMNLNNERQCRIVYYRTMAGPILYVRAFAECLIQGLVFPHQAVNSRLAQPAR